MQRRIYLNLPHSTPSPSRKLVVMKLLRNSYLTWNWKSSENLLINCDKVVGVLKSHWTYYILYYTDSPNIHSRPRQTQTWINVNWVTQSLWTKVWMTLFKFIIHCSFLPSFLPPPTLYIIQGALCVSYSTNHFNFKSNHPRRLHFCKK